jgi:hypothetical protein
MTPYEVNRRWELVNEARAIAEAAAKEGRPMTAGEVAHNARLMGTDYAWKVRLLAGRTLIRNG